MTILAIPITLALFLMVFAVCRSISDHATDAEATHALLLSIAFLLTSIALAVGRICFFITGD